MAPPPPPVFLTLLSLCSSSPSPGWLDDGGVGGLCKGAIRRIHNEDLQGSPPPPPPTLRVGRVTVTSPDNAWQLFLLFFRKLGMKAAATGFPRQCSRGREGT